MPISFVFYMVQGEERTNIRSSRALSIEVRAKWHMRRSKLEIDLDILKMLAQKGPLKLAQIMYKVNVNCDELKKYVEFLTKQGLVEKRLVGGERIVFVINQKGLTLLESWKELNQSLPAVENQTEGSPFLETQFLLGHEEE